MSEKRFVQAEWAAWVGIVGNVLLAVMKAAVGFASGSKALIADAAHSASDVAGSFAALIGLKAAKKPPDEDHPYGHGKAEPVAAIIVSILLVVVGVEIGISSVKSIYQSVDHAPKWFAIIAIVLSIAAKEAMFQYKFRLGKKLESHALVANAWEHRSDVFSSLAALAGVGGAVLGGIWGLPILYYLDPLAGMLVSLLVIRMGYKLVMEAIHNTLDHVLHGEDARELTKAIENVSGVLNVDEMRAREHGHYLVVDVKIGVHPRISVFEGHRIGKRVKTRLMERFQRVTDVLVHVNPYDPGYPYKQNIDSDEDDQPHFIH